MGNVENERACLELQRGQVRKYKRNVRMVVKRRELLYVEIIQENATI